MDYIYFTIAAGTPAAAPIAAWNASINAQRDWVRAFAKRNGFAKAEWIGTHEVVYGFAPKLPKDVILHSEREKVWSEFLQQHPLWRRIAPRRGGSNYVVPRKIGAEAKAVATEWAKRPKVMGTDQVAYEITGLWWDDTFVGMTRHTCGWRGRPGGGYLFAVPYVGTKSTNWKPADGLVRGDQDALRDEWNAKSSKD